jgi:hypothetical protein
VAAKPEPATTEPLELEWSGEGVGMGENGVRFTYAPPPSPMRE